MYSELSSRMFEILSNLTGSTFDPIIEKPEIRMSSFLSCKEALRSRPMFSEYCVFGPDMMMMMSDMWMPGFYNNFARTSLPEPDLMLERWAVPETGSPQTDAVLQVPSLQALVAHVVALMHGKLVKRLPQRLREPVEFARHTLETGSMSWLKDVRETMFRDGVSRDVIPRELFPRTNPVPIAMLRLMMRRWPTESQEEIAFGFVETLEVNEIPCVVYLLQYVPNRFWETKWARAGGDDGYLDYLLIHLFQDLRDHGTMFEILERAAETNLFIDHILRRVLQRPHTGYAARVLERIWRSISAKRRRKAALRLSGTIKKIRYEVEDVFAMLMEPLDGKTRRKVESRKMKEMCRRYRGLNITDSDPLEMVSELFSQDENSIL